MIPIGLAEACRHQQFAGVHSRDAVDTAQVGEAEPLTRQGGDAVGGAAAAGTALA